MTRSDGRCDGKNCFHEFTNGETYLYLDTEEEYIYCCYACAIEGMGDPFKYETFYDREEEET